MTNHKTVKIELDVVTAKMLETWYETVKEPLFLDNFGEFLLATSRYYMKPYFRNISPENVRELDKILEENRSTDLKQQQF